MGSKKTVETKQANTLPDWLVSPYQSALSSAQTAAQQPAISSGTQAAINRTMQTGQDISQFGGATAGILGNMASGNFGSNGKALTDAAGGSFLASNPFAQNGQPTSFAGNGGLNTNYIDSSGLNAFANGTGGSNPFASNGQRIALSDALSGFLTNGGGYTPQAANAVSTALNGFNANGGLDTSYLNNSGLNKTAAGDYLTADSNPYIRGVAQQGADAAQAAINAQFGNAGRSNGSGLYAQLFGQGIADATNNVYAQNYANERQLQQGAQGTLLSAEAAARENALARQYGAAGSIFGSENTAAENASNRNATAQENALSRQYGAATSQFGAQNSAAENALARQNVAIEANLGRQQNAQATLLGAQQTARENALSRQSNAQESAAARQASAYDAERARQQAASGGLLDAQLSASSQIPGILSAILNGNTAALQAGQYQDTAQLNQDALYQSILSQLAAPFGQSSGTQTSTTSGLGGVLGSILQLGGAASSLIPGLGLASKAATIGSKLGALG